SGNERVETQRAGLPQEPTECAKRFGASCKTCPERPIGSVIAEPGHGDDTLRSWAQPQLSKVRQVRGVHLVRHADNVLRPRQNERPLGGLRRRCAMDEEPRPRITVQLQRLEETNHSPGWE